MERAALSAEATDCGALDTVCLHCGAQVASGNQFCCAGCESAAQLAQHAKLSSSVPRQNFSVFASQNDAGHYVLNLAVEGIHCASCIRLIESALYEQAGVVSARVNMSTSRLVIVWSGSQGWGDRLAKIVAELGYCLKPLGVGEHRDVDSKHEGLLRRIAVAGFAMGNLMMISIGLWSSDAESMGVATQGLFHWISALIALPTVFYAGQPFFASAMAVLQKRHTNMDVPISLALILACAMSLFETINHGAYIYFDSAVMLMFFLLIGRYLDARAKGKARQYAQGLLSMLAGTATVVKGGVQSVIPIRDLRKDMEVAVSVGENVPADGVVSQGVSELDMSLITGETLPQAIGKGDSVFAGTTNIAAPIRVKVSKASDNSLLSDIVKLLEKAEQGQAHYVRLADKAAQLYTPVVHSLGLLTFLGWWLFMGQAWQASLLNAITVLIITCPCALGLAVPVVQVLASSRLMKQGILLKSGDALEKLAKIDVAVFDKTGTLTLGQPELLGGDYSQADLQLAASLAVHSKHPLSRAFCRAYRGVLLPVSNVEEVPSCGVRATIDGQVIKLGSRKWCGDADRGDDLSLELWLQRARAQPVRFAFQDQLRDDAKMVMARLRASGIKTVLLSGDRKQPVVHIATQLGIDEYYAMMSPVEKSDYLQSLKSEGHKVLMVGDGLNDAPSLGVADVSMSPSTAMDVTQNTADIVFQGSWLSPVYCAWQTACQSTDLVKQNFALAVIYNIIAIPVAVMGFVTPLIAALAMSGSSLVVIGNSFRLNWDRKDS